MKRAKQWLGGRHRKKLVLKQIIELACTKDVHITYRNKYGDFLADENKPEFLGCAMIIETGDSRATEHFESLELNKLEE